jgi:hypothetical protein
MQAYLRDAALAANKSRTAAIFVRARLIGCVLDFRS